ncbi:TPA: helix-turn-helix domain-containing protein, partial [Escherichia coli]
LLIYSNHTVGKVAGICGYDNASYFVSVFRGYFGVPPRQYLSRFS